MPAKYRDCAGPKITCIHSDWYLLKQRTCLLRWVRSCYPDQAHLGNLLPGQVLYNCQVLIEPLIEEDI